MTATQHAQRAPRQVPISTPRFKVLFLFGGREKESPWIHSTERAQQALELMRAKYGPRNCILYRD